MSQKIHIGQIQRQLSPISGVGEAESLADSGEEHDEAGCVLQPQEVYDMDSPNNGTPRCNQAGDKKWSSLKY